MERTLVFINSKSGICQYVKTYSENRFDAIAEAEKVLESFGYNLEEYSFYGEE